MCQKSVKKGYMEKGEQLYLDSNVEYYDLKDFFKGSICNFLDVKICKKGYMEMGEQLYLEP